MSEKGLRYNQGKTRFSLIPKSALNELAKVLSYGAEKYTVRDENGKVISDGSNNWRKGLMWKDVLDSAHRHLEAFENGEDNDPESGLLHLGHLMANVSFLIDFYKSYPQGDNREHHYLNDKKIFIDIDGVLANFSLAYSDKAREMGLLNKDEVYEQRHWNFKYEHGPVWEAIKNDEDFWLNIQPLCEPNFGFEPCGYVTSRNIPSEITQKWISKFNFPSVPVYTTNGESKVPILKELGCDIFVDDYWGNFLEITKAGIVCYLFDTTYNRKYNVGYKRITDLKQIVN